MITHMLRVLLARQVKPFTFHRDLGFLPQLDVPTFGLYVHVPFCRSLCDFCPYFKVLARRDQIRAFIGALVAEIGLVGRRLRIDGRRRTVSTLYFGGGSPAIIIDDLATVRRAIDNEFCVDGVCGIELHPRDVRDDTAMRLRAYGFDTVCLGVQSFSTALQRNLGRTEVDGSRALRILGLGGFRAVDVDLIFAIPGQTEADLCGDFARAVELGATQISTYPFIDFSYAAIRRRPLSRRRQRRMLDSLLITADGLGFERTSVWTFARKGTPRYSSITRDFFVGFGPSAASLGQDAFKLNTFCVDSYVQAVGVGRIPTAVRMRFTPRSRRLYWLFWNAYTGMLGRSEYRTLFGTEIDKDFGAAMALAERAKLVEASTNGWAVTARGSRLFHRIEQLYTRQYIDKTWRKSIAAAWPESFRLY